MDSYTLWTFLTSARRSALAAVAACAVLTLPGCTSPHDSGPRPVVVMGIDGLEWNLVLELLHRGEMPNLAKQMSRGSYGRIKTQHPSLSPSIWTSVATGHHSSAHGIRGFVKSRKVLFTNRDRKVKALWNIASEHGLKSHVVGWWMTYPVEPIDGVMVAQVNTALSEVREEDGILKGQLVQGLAHQVHPPELSEPMLALAADVERDLDGTVKEIFSNVPSDADASIAPLWRQSLWAVRADVIYERIALEALRRKPDVDLALWYFGGTDVLGHRFWRWTFPELYTHPPSRQSVAAYGEVLRDYYRYTDQVIGRLLAAAPADANIILMSDHGMGPANRKRDFDKPSNKPPRTGGHGRTEAFLVMAGPDIVAGGGPAPGKLTEKDIRVLGSIYDVAPTVLALLGLPVGNDMKGQVMTSLVDPKLFERRPVATVATHTPGGWSKSRNLPEAETPAQDERLEQLRSLGYIQ